MTNEGVLRTVRYASVPLWPRVVNVVVGAWLFASAFLWPHDGNVAFNDWMVGLIVATTALQAVWAPKLRWANTFLGAWLGLWAVTLDYTSRASRVHDLAVAGIIVLASVVRSGVPEQLLL